MHFNEATNEVLRIASAYLSPDNHRLSAVQSMVIRRRNANAIAIVISVNQSKLAAYMSAWHGERKSTTKKKLNNLRLALPRTFSAFNRLGYLGRVLVSACA